MSVYYRPLIRTDATRPDSARTVAGAWCWFDQVERLERGQIPEILPADMVPAQILQAITRPRSPVAGLSMDRPLLMGILNVTPDSFSDGGQFDGPDRAVAHAIAMAKTGADIIDIGGESTRPGAADVSAATEIARTEPVIRALRGKNTVAISVDTRKSTVARVAVQAGATVVNDVSALSYDAELSGVIAKTGVSVCLMHAQGDPADMQINPGYDHVLLDVFDALSDRIDHAVAQGISRDRIIVDPGIGFGKTPAHNLELIRNVSLFHALGCPILLGTSRKSFIGALSDEPDATRRLPGSIALALLGIMQGVQITRVHDIAEMRQALTIWQAVTGIGHQE